MAPYFDAKSGEEVVFTYAVDALEAVESGRVITTKGSKPAASKSESVPAPNPAPEVITEPIKEEPIEEPASEDNEKPASRKAPRRRSAD